MGVSGIKCIIVKKSTAVKIYIIHWILMPTFIPTLYDSLLFIFQVHIMINQNLLSNDRKKSNDLLIVYSKIVMKKWYFSTFNLHSEIVILSKWEEPKTIFQQQFNRQLAKLFRPENLLAWGKQLFSVFTFFHNIS